MKHIGFKISNKSQPHKVSSFFTTKKWYLLALMVIIPAVLQQILSASMNLLDNIMVGNLSDRFIPDLNPMNANIKTIFTDLGLWEKKDWWVNNGLEHFFQLHYSAGQIAVSGVTGSNQIFVIIFAIMGGFINAVGIFGAQFYGAGRYGSLRQTVRMKIIFGFLVGTLVIILSYTIGTYLISYTTSPATALEKFNELCNAKGLANNDIEHLKNILDYNNPYVTNDITNFINARGIAKDDVQFTQIILRYYEYRSAQLATIQGASYNQWIVFSYPLLGINFAFVSVFRETKHGYIPLFLTFVSVIINFLLNLILINGLGAIGGIGARGSAVATLTARIVQLALISGFVMWKKYEFQPKILKMFKIRRDLFKKILIKAWPLMLNDLSFAIASTMIIRLISQWSFDALSGSAIASTINTMFYTLYIGFGIASSVLIANRLGANDIVGAKYNAKHLIRLGFMVSLGFAGLLVLSSFFLPQLLFSATNEALRISSWMMRIDAMVFSAYTILYTCIYAFRAGGLGITVLLVDSGFTWIFTVLALFLQVKYNPLDIIFIYGIMRTADVVKMILVWFIYHYGKWARNLAGNMNKPYPETPPPIVIVTSEQGKSKDKMKIANF
ncbi:MATE family efflux transporter [Spiroplasma endosymbiont of Virgichneumon dumeticola]|uniref:MATE family efflux transporter n=1 Tax=Spiroplasma endosymbiont of Virgichneumon dumeticola TaxID=3139323 RepID=UPI0035C910A8